MSAVWQVRLLGPVSLAAEGSEVPLGGLKPRAVLALLALASPRPRTVDSIVDALWGEDPPASARNAIQVYVSGLRKVLHDSPALIERVGDGYRFVTGGVRVDAAEFAERVAEGGAMLRAGRASTAESMLRQALDLWAGDVLSGLEDFPFHSETAEALRSTHTQAMLEWADSLLRSGEYPRAVEAARAATRLSVYDERAWEILATAQYHCARQKDALDTCRELRHLLAEELGLDPSPRFVEMERAILQQTLSPPPPEEVVDPADEPATADQAPGPPPAPRLPRLPVPFVGRGPLVAEILRALDLSPLVTLVGLGGIGKTTVALATAQELASRGRTVYFCELAAETTPLDALTRVCRVAGLEPEADPVRTLQGLGEEVVLVLDNVEQVPDLGIDLARLLSTAGPTCLVTSRKPLQIRLEHPIQVGSLEVGGEGTDPSPAAQLLLHRVRRQGGDAHPEDVAAAEGVCAILDGIPLAIELLSSRASTVALPQLARQLVAQQGLALDEGALQDVPDRQISLRTVISSTVQDLSAPPRGLLDGLASCSGWTTLELLAQILDVDEAQVLMHSGELVSSGLAGADQSGRLRLRMPVVTQLREGGAPLPLDRRVAEVIARWADRAEAILCGPESQPEVDRLGRDHDNVVVAHLRSIAEGAPALAARVALGLGRYWLLKGQINEGRRWTEAVLAMDGHGEADRVRLALQAGTYASYVDAPETLADLGAALAEAERVDLPVDRLVVNGWCCLAAVQAQRGHLEEARTSVERARAAAAISGQPELVELGRDIAGHVASYAGDIETSVSVGIERLDDARLHGSRTDLLSALCFLAFEMAQSGRPQEALVLSGEAFELAGTLTEGALVGHALLVHGLMQSDYGDAAAARGCLLAALRLGEDSYRNAIHRANALAGLAAHYAAQRQDGEAATLFGAAERLLTDDGFEASARLHTWSTREAVRERLPSTDWDAQRLRGTLDPDRLIHSLLRSSPTAL